MQPVAVTTPPEMVVLEANIPKLAPSDLPPTAVTVPPEISMLLFGAPNPKLPLFALPPTAVICAEPDTVIVPPVMPLLMP